MPYKLKCKPKLVFEIEPMENLSENDVSNAAGGAPGLREKAKKAREWMKQFESGSYACSPSSPSNSCVFPVVNDVDLGGVAGGIDPPPGYVLLDENDIALDTSYMINSKGRPVCNRIRLNSDYLWHDVITINGNAYVSIVPEIDSDDD